MTDFASDQDRINDIYYPTHLLSFNFDGNALCGGRGRINTTIYQDEVTCKKCKEDMGELLTPKTEESNRIKLAVYVDLDRVPGVFHTAESARLIMNNLLKGLIPHYNPAVSIERKH